MNVRYHKIARKLTDKPCFFRLSLGLSTQILEVEGKQAYKIIETRVLV